MREHRGFTEASEYACPCTPPVVLQLTQSTRVSFFPFFSCFALCNGGAHKTEKYHSDPDVTLCLSSPALDVAARRLFLSADLFLEKKIKNNGRDRERKHLLATDPTQRHPKRGAGCLLFFPPNIVPILSGKIFDCNPKVILC